MRISIDAKAKKNIGNLSAGGKSRFKNPLISDDHDTEITEKLVPYGIKNMTNGENSFYFGKSKETADFIVDCIKKWLKENEKQMEDVEELVINLDNGPEQRSNRTKFWNGIILDSIEKIIKVVKNMICGGKKPVPVQIIDKIYEKGVTIKKDLRKNYEKFLIKMGYFN